VEEPSTHRQELSVLGVATTNKTQDANNYNFSRTLLHHLNLTPHEETPEVYNKNGTVYFNLENISTSKFCIYHWFYSFIVYTNLLLLKLTTQH
jgi:hypothetical protein